jgi:hypothetical protein
MAKEKLTTTTSRLGRVKSVRPNLRGGLTMTSEVLHLTFPMCEQHARQTHWANIILDKSPLIQLLQFLAYFGALFALSFVIRPKSFVSDFGWFSLYPLFGVLGVAAIVWAKRTTSVWPLRFDPDMEVIELSFRNEEYATRFKALNREATSSRLTEAPPWYKRSLIWKIVMVLALILFLAKLMGHR